MATLQYTVYDNAGATPQGPVLAEGILTISGTSARTSAPIYAAGGNRAVAVRIAADGDCWVNWGDSGVDATNDGEGGRMMFANSWEYPQLTADQYIAVIEKA